MENLVRAIQLALLLPPLRRRVLAVLEEIVRHLRVGNAERLLGTLEAILEARSGGRKL